MARSNHCFTLLCAQDAELMQVQALASTLTAAASPAEGLEAARVATAQLMESVRGASSTSDAVPEVASSRTAADPQQSQADASIGDCCAAQVRLCIAPTASESV